MTADEPRAVKPRHRSPFAAIVGYTLRTCIPARRILLLLPAAGVILFGLLSTLSDEDTLSAFVRVTGNATHSLVLPITCLIVGDAVLGAEVRSGVFSFTWLSPVRHSTIVAGRWLGGWIVAAVMLAPALIAAALLAGAPAAAGPAVLAAMAGAAAYLALFVAIGATFGRPIVWSLAMVILVERLLGAALTGVAQVSPGWLAQSVLLGLTGSAADLTREGIPSGWSAVARLGLVAAVGLTTATRRLRRLRPASATD